MEWFESHQPLVEPVAEPSYTFIVRVLALMLYQVRHCQVSNTCVRDSREVGIIFTYVYKCASHLTRSQDLTLTAQQVSKYSLE